MIRYLVERAWWFWPSFAMACSALAWGVEWRVGCGKERRGENRGYRIGYGQAMADLAEVGVLPDPADRIIGDALSAVLEPYEGPDLSWSCTPCGTRHHPGDICWTDEREPPLEPLPPEPGDEWAEQLAAMPHIPSEPEDLPRPGPSALVDPPTGALATDAGPGQPDTIGRRIPIRGDDQGRVPGSSRGIDHEPAGDRSPESGSLSPRRDGEKLASATAGQPIARLTPAQRRRARHKRRGPYRPQAHPAVLAAIAAQFVPPPADDPRFWDKLAVIRDGAYAFVDGWAAAA
jgi:antitoxin (DNA-binding transcriptional repressor) of toxin-antitoxin stability system